MNNRVGAPGLPGSGRGEEREPPILRREGAGLGGPWNEEEGVATGMGSGHPERRDFVEIAH